MAIYLPDKNNMLYLLLLKLNVVIPELNASLDLSDNPFHTLIFLCHVQIKLLDPLGLRGQKIRVLEQFRNLHQEVAVREIYGIVRRDGFFPEVRGIQEKYLKYRIAGIKVVVQCYHAVLPNK